MRYTLLCLVWIVFATFTSLQSVTSAQSSSEDELLIFAASSLTDSFAELSERFEQDNNINITINYAGSSTLAAQLVQGAPADIFASANLQQMQALIEENLILEETVRIFAENELVIIVPADNPANIESAQDLAQDDLILVFAAPSVPIREYTNQLLDNLTSHYGENFPETVMANLVSEEANVRQVAARVALGEADAAVVYRTDITPDIVDDVLIINVPEGSSPRATYPISPLINAENSANANLFIDFILSQEGQSILREWGFCSPASFSPEQTPEPEMTSEPEATPESNEVEENETSC